MIFIFDDSVDSDFAQKFIRRLRTVLTTKLGEGIAYELDMRLRPSGRSGPPAVMLQSFRDHHFNRAHNWEHIALAHSRIIAGDQALGQTVIKLRGEILSRPRNQMQFINDAQVMWNRIATQRISQTPANIFNSKLRAGGLMQAEYTQACGIILGRTIDIETDISFWSHLQMWERLLGLTQKPLADIPDFYTPAFLQQLGANDMADISARQSERQNSVTHHYQSLLQAPPLDNPAPETQIRWID